LAAKGTDKIPRIGFVTAQPAAGFAPFLEPFRVGLGEFGYAQGRNLGVEFRYGDDRTDRVPELVAELLRLPIDLLVVQGAAVRVVAKLDLPVPVVYAFSGDPVTAGFAESLARPRGNMTGLSFMWSELTGKRLELLHEMIPKLRRVAIVANPQHPGEHLERTASEEAARLLDATIAYFPTRSIEE
jgi:putative ABC transport system substrate-binding protein